jgi:hypothetical protein
MSGAPPDIVHRLIDLGAWRTNLEVFAVGGLIAYYAWMMTHCVPEVSIHIPLLPYSTQWIIPILLPILGLFRSKRHLGQIRQIANYVRAIEDQLAASGTPVGPKRGWEHFIDEHRRRWFGSGRLASWLGFWSFQASHIGVWLLLITGTCSIAVIGKDLSKTCISFSGL